MLSIRYFKCNNCGYIFEQVLPENTGIPHCPQCRTPSVEVGLTEYLAYTRLDD